MGWSLLRLVGDCRAPQGHVDLGSGSGLEKIQVGIASKPQRFEGRFSSMLSFAAHLQESA